MSVTTGYAPERYAGDGAQTVFEIPWPFIRPDQVRVTRTAGGVDALLTQGTHYTVKRGAGVGGTFTMLAAPTTGVTLTVWRDMPLEQPDVYPQTGVFDLKTAERGFDRLTMMVQQVAEGVGRAVKVAITSDTSPDMLMDDINTALAGTLVAAGQAEERAAAAETARAVAEDARDGAEMARAGSEAARDEAQLAQAAVAQAVADARQDVVASAAFVPIGAILDFPVNTVPVGFLVCAGQVVTKEAYPELVAYLTGDALALSATLPDYRGTVGRAADLGRGLAPDVVVGGYLADAFQGHVHRQGHANGIDGSTYDVGRGNSTTGVLWDSKSANTQGPISDGVNGTPRTATETRGKSYGVVRCIKAYHAPMGAEPVDIAEVMNRLDALAAVVSPEVGRFCLVGATTSGQSFPANVNTTVAALGGRVQFGGEGWPDAGDGSLSIVVPEAGTYEIEAKLTLLSGTNSSAFAWISVNGSLLSASIAYAPTTYWTSLHPRVVRTLAAGDIVRIVTQSTATTQSGSGGTATLTLQRVR